MKVSQQIPRPENTLRKSDKQFLPDVSFEDARYRQTLGYLNPMLNNLLEPLNNLITDLNPYEKYLNLNAAIFLRQNPIIKTVKEELIRLEEMDQHVGTMPYFSCARLVEIDFRELKNELENRLESYKESILRWAH